MRSFRLCVPTYVPSTSYSVGGVPCSYTHSTGAASSRPRGSQQQAAPLESSMTFAVNLAEIHCYYLTWV